MKKILITICVAVGVYFAFSNTIDEFLYPEKRPGLNTYDTYTTTTQQTTTAVTQQTPIVTDEDGYEPRDDRKPDYVQPADPTWSKRTTGNSVRSISSDPSEDALSATQISIPSPTELSITEGINLRSISTPFQFNMTTDTLFISFQTKTPFNAVPSSLKPPILTRIN